MVSDTTLALVAEISQNGFKFRPINIPQPQPLSWQNLNAINLDQHGDLGWTVEVSLIVRERIVGVDWDLLL